jgi:hypothetical protein
VANCPNRGIEELQGFPVEGVTEIHLDHNPIRSFVGFPANDRLVKLTMDGVPIENFKGFPRLPGLQYISLKGTPVMRRFHARTALVILVGAALRQINGESVTSPERQIAASFPARAAAAIREGWMPEMPPPDAQGIEKIILKFVEANKVEREREVLAVKQSEENLMPKSVKMLSEHLEGILKEQENQIAALQNSIQELSK